MKLLIIGNGSTGVDIENGLSYINNHTGDFLQALSGKHKVTFSQFTTVYNRNSNLQNFELSKSGIGYCNLPNKKHPLFIFKLISLIMQHDFVYIFYPGTLGTLVGVLSLLLRKPYGLYVRGEHFTRFKLDNRVLKGSEFILTISPLFVSKLHEYCSKVAVIKPMIAITSQDFKTNRVYFNKDVVRFLFVGRVEFDKGIYELIDIANYLKSKAIKCIIDVVGGGDLYETIGQRLQELGLKKFVILHGQVADKHKLKALYDSADVFLFPSHHEGFPRVLYEAMASALPIFTTFVGGISGRMTHLENCIEIPVKNGDGAAQLVYEYISNTEVLKHIGKTGQNTLGAIIDGTLLTHHELVLNYLADEK